MQSTFILAISVLVYAFILRVILSKTIRIQFFSTGLFFDSITLVLLFLLMTMALPYLWVQKVFYIIFIVFFTLLAVIDRIYHRYFFTLTTRSNAQGLTVFKGDADLTKEYNIRLGWQDIVVFLLGILSVAWIGWQPTSDAVIHDERSIGWGVVLALLIIHIVIYLVFKTFRKPSVSMAYYRSRAYLFDSMYDRSAYARSFGYYYYHLIDLFRHAPKIDIEKAKESLEGHFSMKEAHKPNPETGLLKGMNVVHITVESLDTRFINKHITPTLYRMLNNGYTFPNTYVPVFQQGATCNGEFMATTGLYAINSNIYANNLCHKYRENHFPYSLPAQLKKAGYKTYYFHSGHGWFYHRKTFMPHVGFDTVKFQEDLKSLGHKNFCERFDTQLIHFIDQYLDTKDPFYMQILTYGMHGAYNQTDYQHQNKKIDQVYDDTLDAEVRVYLQKLAEFDDFLTKMMDQLSASHVADKTLFVIAPDHYPYMLDINTYGSLLNLDPTSTDVHKQTLIMYHQALSPKPFSQVGSLIDITPTVLNLVYPEAEFKYFNGVDLTAGKAGVALLHDLSIVDGHNRMALNKPYIGLPHAIPQLEKALVEHIRQYELQTLLFETDYFRKLR